jgi:glycosyltransferase involved in cell wall biosynthesis
MSPAHSADLNERKALGRAHLEANRVEDALRVYARILRDYPNDVDAYLFLGDCYLAEGDGETALLLYGQAHERDSQDPEIRRRIRLAKADCPPAACPAAWDTADGLSALKAIPTETHAVIRLLQRLIGQEKPVTEGEVLKATELLREIIHNPHPAQAVAERLEEIDQLLPALLELNIRQARLDGRPDLAQALQHLLENIQLQLRVRPGPIPGVARGVPDAARSQGAATPTAPGEARPPADLRVLFLYPAAAEPAVRQTLPAEALCDLGVQTSVKNGLPPEGVGAYDLVVASRPHADPAVMEGLAACAAAQVPVILDLDTDFESIPLDHPEYASFGLGTPGHARAYAAAMFLADTIRTPSATFTASLVAAGRPAHLIPDGWSQSNELWRKPAAPRHTLNLGWVACPGQLDDLLQIRRVLIRVLREFPHVHLVIGGEPQAYRVFDTLPEGRRLFLPAASPEDYPYLLGQVDILAVPLRNTPFNQGLSDRRLMEAGVRGIPWVASPIPAFNAWNAGGLVAYSPEEWHTYLRQLVIDAGLRASLGQAGRQQAEDREMGSLAKAWLALIQQTLAGREAPSSV